MKKTLNYRYMLKRALPIMAFVGAGLMAGCEPEPEQKPQPTPTVETPIDPVKVLRFGTRIGIDSISYDNIMKYANDPRITKIIYFNDSTNNNNNYTGYDSQDISYMREELQKRLDYTSKSTGAGTLIFRRNAASVQDSLWFIVNGWKIRVW